MEILRIRRLNAHYNLPLSQKEERERLDRVLGIVLDEALERALERANVSPYEEVCIRSLHIPVRLRLSLTDSSLATAWSLALSEIIMHARNDEYVPNVVRYNSIAHALFDMAVGVANDRYERTWAWRLVHIWNSSDSPSASDAITELISVLLKKPTLITPLLTALTADNIPYATFAVLLRRIPAKQWMELAHAALHATGASISIIEKAFISERKEKLVYQAQRMVDLSTIAHAVTSYSQILRNTQELCLAFAALIVLEQDPAILHSIARARDLISVISSAMYDAMNSEVLRMPVNPSPMLCNDNVHEPQTFLNEDKPIVITRRALTRFGGLLFLLKLIEKLGLPDEILNHCALRSFRWMQHQLALALVPAEPDDPAVLAFAGLLPNTVPPNHNEDPPTDVERETVDLFVERIKLSLDDLLDEKRSLSFVCHRAAEIVADPGWIEVRLSLSEVSTVIRRIGLDLDPGYLPWLGVAVRFVYE